MSCCLAPLPLLAHDGAIDADRKGARFGSPDAVPNQLARDESGWTQLQRDLAERGIRFSVDYSSVALKASSALPGADDDSAGGMVRFYGTWDLVGQGSPDTGSFIWKLEHRHDFSETEPKLFLFDVGALGLITPSFSDEGERLTNLYWRQRMHGGRTAVVAGLLDITDYLDVFALASPWTGFMNFAFSTGSNTIPLPGDAALGLAGATMLNDNWFVIGGLADMNGEPTDPFETIDTFFNENKYLKSIELGWTASHEQIYTDNVHVTLWHADESEVQGTSDGWGVSLSASRQFGRWLPFLRAGYSDDTGALFEKSVSVGVGYLGLGNAGSTLGVAVNWGDVDDDDDQWITELYYLWKVLPSLELTVNLQHIAEPALNPDESSITVSGVRARITL